MPRLDQSLFTTEFLRADQRFQAWSDSIGVMLDVRLDDQFNPALFQSRIESYLIDDIMLSRCVASEQKFDRSKAKIARDGIDHYLIQIFRRGVCDITIGSKQVHLPTGIIAGFDMAEVVDSYNTDFDLLSLVIPRHRLAPLLLWPDNVMGAAIDPTQGTGVLFADFLESLYAAAPTMTAVAAKATATSILHLTASALNQSPGQLEECPSAVTRAQLLKCRNFIEANLHLMDLSAGAIAVAINMSRHSLARLFESYGGVDAYIRKRRIARGHRLLVAQGIGPRLVDGIAAQVGFRNPDEFTRGFQQVFGMTPEDALAPVEAKSDGGSLRKGMEFGDHLYEQWISDVI